ncbi:hypothetical protein AMECASPLE_035177 [Ameca splendens]|uniref:Uncharacterized protein n=1 Tax=Ameca splendens TaxID=208324 RepID=A0ABV0ZS42_9TELE
MKTVFGATDGVKGVFRLDTFEYLIAFVALCSFEAPLAGMLTERRQVVRKQYEAVQQRRALQDTTNHLRNNTKDSSSPLPHALASVFVLASQTCPTLHLDPTQKMQLQQQVQQHVQLLTQVYLLSRRIHALNHETHVTKRYLVSKPHRPPLNCKAGFRARLGGRLFRKAAEIKTGSNTFTLLMDS